MMGMYPAVVREYDREARQCRIEIPGVTDGGEVLPLAECMQPLGDRTEDNEIRIKVGDDVYVQFLAGDPRHPVIVGHRAKNTGNNVGRRHFEQDNIHTIANETQLHEAGQTITLLAGESITLQVGGVSFVLDAAGLTAIGLLMPKNGIAALGEVTANGVNIGSDHTHTEQGDGADVSTPH